MEKIKKIFFKFEYFGNNIDGLALLVQRKFNLDPFSNALFVFCNRKRDKLKILFWDKNGFWLYYRRLESGHFNWPQIKDTGHTLAVSEQQLSCYLTDCSLWKKMPTRKFQ